MQPKLALVTGASSGIGSALCHLLASKSIDLIISGRDSERLSDLSKSLREKCNVTVVPADLSKEEGINQLNQVIEAQTPDLVINNAGWGLYGLMEDQDPNELIDLLKVNGEAVMRLSLAATKAMKGRQVKGIVVNVSSAASFFPYPGFAAYAAAKRFVNELSQAMDVELEGSGIRVLTACPGMVATAFKRTASRGKTEEAGPPWMVMTAEEAADHIWWQIMQGKRLYLFNWKYRLGIFILTYLFPRKLSLKILKNSVLSRV